MAASNFNESGDTVYFKTITHNCSVTGRDGFSITLTIYGVAGASFNRLRVDGRNLYATAQLFFGNIYVLWGLFGIIIIIVIGTNTINLNSWVGPISADQARLLGYLLLILLHKNIK